MSQNPSRTLAALAYAGGLAILVVNLSDFGVAAWPIEIDETLWRFRVVGQLGGQMVVIFLGLLLVIAAASMADHRRVQRTSAVVCGALAILAPLLLASYVLDVAQIQSVVAPEQALDVTKGSIQTEARFGLLALALGVVSWLAWKGTHQADRSSPAIVSSSRKGATRS